jgi:IS5 family transposase
MAPLTALHDRVVELGRPLKVTRGGNLRVDGLVVVTTVHHPTDSGLIGDGMRALSPLLRGANAVLGRATGLRPQAFHMWSARRLGQQLHRLAGRRGGETTTGLQRADGRLIGVAQKTFAQAVQVGVVKWEQAASRV